MHMHNIISDLQYYAVEYVTEKKFIKTTKM